MYRFAYFHILFDRAETTTLFWGEGYSYIPLFPGGSDHAVLSKEIGIAEPVICNINWNANYNASSIRHFEVMIHLYLSF